MPLLFAYGKNRLSYDMVHSILLTLPNVIKTSYLACIYLVRSNTVLKLCKMDKNAFMSISRYQKCIFSS